MNKGELKQYLEEYWYDDQYMKEKLRELEKIKTHNQKVNNIYSCDILEDNNSPLVLAEQQENIILKNIIKKKQKIEEMLYSLSQPYKTILYFKYICFLSFDQIADRMNYSTKRIYQLHSEALDKLLDTFNSQQTNISTH